jgi:hypothetical protein
MPTIADILAVGILMPRFNLDGTPRGNRSGESEDLRAARDRARARTRK